MSAFIVSDAHLNYILNFVNQIQNSPTLYTKNGDTRTEFRTQNMSDLDTVGNILVSANYASINARYKESEQPHVFEFTLKIVPGGLNPVQVIKACNCFDYQASEVENYEQSVAAQIIEQIRSAAIQNLPGYEDAAWEVTA